MEFEIDHFKLWDNYLADKNKKRRKAYFQDVPLKMRGKICDEFIADVKLLETHVDFFDWWDIVKEDYNTEKEINASTSQQIKLDRTPNTTWRKSRDQTVEQSIYPPFEEIEINWKGAKIIAAPFKEVNGNAELEKIKSQNNYTNQMLHIMSQQMEKLEIDKPKKKKIEKPLIKPNEELRDFKLNNDEALIEKITKQLELLDIKAGKQIMAVAETDSNKDSEEESDESLSKQFEDKMELNKMNTRKYNRPKIPHYYPRPSLPDVQLEER